MDTALKKLTIKIKAHSFIKEYMVLIFYLFYSFIVFGPFLSGQQRVHDSYLVELFDNYGFMVRGLFNQGRIISSWFYSALLHINPPYTLAMSISVGASLIFLSLAAYIVFCLIKKFAALEDCRNSYILAALGSLMLFFNLFILESMLFFENAVMSLGILLAVVACALLMRDGIKWYIASLFCMILSMFCYQPSSAFFPPLAVLFLGIKHQNELALLIRKILGAALIYGAALFSNFIFLTLISTDTRFAGEVRLSENFANSVRAFFSFGLNNFGFMPNYVFSLFLFVFMCILTYICIRHKMYKILLASIVAFSVIFITTFTLLLPMASNIWYIMPRSGVAIAGIGGLMIISIATCSKKTRKSTLLVAALFVLIISQRQIDIQKNSYANNQLDMQELHNIVNTIRSYEDYHGLTINHIYFTYDAHAWQRKTLNNYGDLTIRILQVSWMPEPLLHLYFGRGVSVMPMSWVMTQEEIERVSYKRESFWFTNGRIVFVEDTAYIFFGPEDIPYLLP